MMAEPSRCGSLTTCTLRLVRTAPLLSSVMVTSVTRFVGTCWTTSMALETKRSVARCSRTTPRRTLLLSSHHHCVMCFPAPAQCLERALQLHIGCACRSRGRPKRRQRRSRTRSPRQHRSRQQCGTKKSACYGSWDGWKPSSRQRSVLTVSSSAIVFKLCKTIFRGPRPSGGSGDLMSVPVLRAFFTRQMHPTLGQMQTPKTVQMQQHQHCKTRTSIPGPRRQQPRALCARHRSRKEATFQTHPCCKTEC